MVAAWNALLLPLPVRQVSMRLPPAPAERALLAAIDLPDGLLRAVPSRQVQFRAGRLCAMHALERLTGMGDLAVGRDEGGAPVWPAGVTGSITHTDDFVSAAVVWTWESGGVGIDTERIMPESRAAHVRAAVASPHELADAMAEGCDEREALTLVFSAKEAVFKCLHPQVGRMFGFHDARLLSVDGARGTFTACLLTTLGERFPAGAQLDGRFVFDGPRVHTAVMLKPDAPAHLPGSTARHASAIGS